MSKRTKSKRSDDPLALFVLALLLCLAGASFCAFQFCASFFRSMSKVDEEPVATITFKYKTAQRKFLDRVVWDRLRQNSPVYSGDTIHTAALSEATLWFPDGTSMDLSENTMAQVFVSKSGSLQAKLSEGFAALDTTESANSATLSMDGMDVTVSSGSAVSASSGGGGALVQVDKGEASASSGDGAISLSEGDEMAGSAGAPPSMPPLTVVSPLKSSRIIHDAEGARHVPFAWRASDSCEPGARIEISTDKSFSRVEKSIDASQTGSAIVDLAAGTWWWRAIASDSSLGASEPRAERLTIIQSLPPTLIAPAAGYVYSYRARTPAVRLIWTESPQASSYKLEISKSPDFSENAVEQSAGFTSAIISTLGEGDWFWRVTPYYSINKRGYTRASKTGTFSVVKRGALSAPVPVSPPEGCSIDTEKGARSLSLSWRMDGEADSYSARVSRSREMSNPVVTRSATENFVEMDAAKELGDGVWWWSVTEYDSEGNASPPSEPRSFLAMKGKIDQRTIEPPDGYISSDSLLPDTKFTWKRNLPSAFEGEMQISSDESFSKMVHSEKINGASAKGITLPVGKYWWRLKSTDSAGGVVMATPPKRLAVVGNLAKARLIEPAGKVSVQESVPRDIKWTAVDGADYYKVTITQNGKRVFEDVARGTEIQVDMFSPFEFVDKAWHKWQVQAFADAVPGVSSRLVGMLSEESFLLYKLRPVEIESPKRGERIDGVEAVLRPPVARWKAGDALRKARLTLYRKDGASRTVVMRFPSDAKMKENPSALCPEAVALDEGEGLQPGDYEMIVSAETVDGIDISNTAEKDIGRFTVLPVKPLDKASGLYTTPSTLNAAYLTGRGNLRKIVLSWMPVSGATNYLVKVSSEETGETVFQKDMPFASSAALDFSAGGDNFLSALVNGRYIWTVEALRKVDTDGDDEGDRTIQRGTVASSSFVVDIPSPAKPTPKGAANPYYE